MHHRTSPVAAVALAVASIAAAASLAVVFAYLWRPEPERYDDGALRAQVGRLESALRAERGDRERDVAKLAAIGGSLADNVRAGEFRLEAERGARRNEADAESVARVEAIGRLRHDLRSEAEHRERVASGLGKNVVALMRRIEALERRAACKCGGANPPPAPSLPPLPGKILPEAVPSR